MFDYTPNIISNFGNAIAGGTKFSSAQPRRITGCAAGCLPAQESQTISRQLYFELSPQQFFKD
jgi:hypothetical protein